MESLTQASEHTVCYTTNDSQASALYPTQINQILQGCGDVLCEFKEVSAEFLARQEQMDPDGNENYTETIHTETGGVPSDSSSSSNQYHFSQADLCDFYEAGEASTEKKDSGLPLGRNRRLAVLLKNNQQHQIGERQHAKFDLFTDKEMGI